MHAIGRGKERGKGRGGREGGRREGGGERRRWGDRENVSEHVCIFLYKQVLCVCCVCQVVLVHVYIECIKHACVGSMELSVVRDLGVWWYAKSMAMAYGVPSLFGSIRSHRVHET